MPSTFLFIYLFFIGQGPESGGYGGPPWRLGVRAWGVSGSGGAAMLIMSNSNQHIGFVTALLPLLLVVFVKQPVFLQLTE